MFSPRSWGRSRFTSAFLVWKAGHRLSFPSCNRTAERLDRLLGREPQGPGLGQEPVAQRRSAAAPARSRSPPSSRRDATNVPTPRRVSSTPARSSSP